MNNEVAAHEVFVSWLSRIGAALESHDARAAANEFIDDGYWRDILAFTWDYRTFSGGAAIEDGFRSTLATVGPANFRPAVGRMAPRFVRRAKRNVVEAYFDFETAVGHGTGFARLQVDDVRPLESRAWLALTTLQSLHGFEESIGDTRPSGMRWAYNFAGDNWLQARRKDQAFDDEQPAVLIIGAGQSGLALAARLTQFSVRALVVEKLPRVGDNWRSRYSSLTLHNEVWANSLPYLPFPDTWPTFVPKDKLAGWLEFYAEAMELNVWTGTELVASTYDGDTKTWTARLRRADGTEREVRTPHIVMATGTVGGTPKAPALAGLDRFSGEVVHSSQFTDGTRYAGKHAIVVGTGNSGHDVAQELHGNGADTVTIMQRSPTCVASLVPSGTMVYALYAEGPAEDIDLITASIPYPVLKDTYQFLTKQTCALDRELLDNLNSVGFETDFGTDDTGFHMKYLRQGGGYYINVGCSDLIAAKEINLVHARDMAAFTEHSLVLTDGSEIPADLVVLATGYTNQQDHVRKIFGSDVADRVGQIWGHNEQGFMRNMWTRTDQDGFWLMGGALMECRLYSRFLALLLKADLENLLPPRTERC